MEKAQIKSIFAILLTFILVLTLIYAVSTTLLSPSDNTVDDDGVLDLRGRCDPIAYSGTTSNNITNATLWTNINGSWAPNATIQVKVGTNGIQSGNSSFLFNFTNFMNLTPEGEYKWNIECNEINESNSTEIRKSFAGNNTIKVTYASPTITILSTSPDDGVYVLNNGVDLNFSASAAPSSEWNITRMALWINSSSAGFSINETYYSSDSNTVLIANFSNLTGLPDGSRIVWSIMANQTKNFSTLGYAQKVAFTSNRTLKVEYPPNITILSPIRGNWSKYTSLDINFSISTTYTRDTQFSCAVYSNDTGVWTTLTGGFIANNGTNVRTVTFLEKSNISYSVRCAEITDQNIYNFSTNFSLGIDTIDPTVTVHTINNSYWGSNVTIEFTATDNNLALINIIATFNATAMNTKHTNTSPVSGQRFIYQFTNLSNGIYNFSIFANDSAGRGFTTSNFTVTVDTQPPIISNIQNLTIENDCDSINLTWDTNETTNFTIYYGTTTNTTSTGVVSSQIGINNSFIINFSFNGDTTFYFNITSCDGGNNCNTSSQYSLLTPTRVCTGWNYYAVYDSIINLSTIQNQSGADLVYVWNATRQRWASFTAGTSVGGNLNVGWASNIFHTVQLFENQNSTWRRNTTNRGAYRYNVTVGDNYVSTPNLYIFGNFTESFQNLSRSFPSTIGNYTIENQVANGSLYGPFNITQFAGYNNSNNRWVNHVYNFTWVNGTTIEPLRIEVVWVWSDFNVSWNASEVYSNWTI